MVIKSRCNGKRRVENMVMSDDSMSTQSALEEPPAGLRGRALVQEQEAPLPQRDRAAQGRIIHEAAAITINFVAFFCTRSSLSMSVIP